MHAENEAQWSSVVMHIYGASIDIARYWKTREEDSAVGSEAAAVVSSKHASHSEGTQVSTLAVNL